MRHLVYKIINLVNNKYYVGIHSTENIKDSYMGSGLYIKASIKKYGLENHRKEILYNFDTREEAIQMERIIVNEEFIKNPLTYNISLGGNAAPFIKEETRLKQSIAAKNRPYSFYENLFKTRKKSKCLELRNKSKEHIEKIRQSNIRNGTYLPENNPMFGKTHSQETRDKISIALNSRSDEAKQAMKSKQSAKAKSRPTVKCPYCDKIGSNNIMKRWHFDNCKLKDAS
ncbi:homing endonuclease [Escherichia phage UGJNEcP4]|nr:homing endonuclease [Escherichia phage UGJNEcP3]CAH1616662.1 homing endonuclease [Escherichia phage UGJNEcP4]CAI9865986.1 homing endonuclease [Escherichia phage UP19]